MFAHNKELDKIEISIPWEKTVLPDQYPHTNYDSLIFSSERYLSKYLFPKESISDAALFFQLNYMLSSMNRSIGRNPSLTTSFSELAETSSARLDGSNVTITLMPLFDHRIQFHDRIDVIVAHSIHESLHIRYTTQALARRFKNQGYVKVEIGRNGKTTDVVDWNVGLKKTFDKKLFASLHNILEDKRIEDLGCEEMPGYSFYLNQGKKYSFWQHINTFENPTHETRKKLAFEEENSDDLIYTNLIRYIGFKVLCPEALKYAWKLQLTPVQEVTYQELKNKVDLILKDFSKEHTVIFQQAQELLKLFPEKYQQQQPFGEEGMLAETTQDDSKGEGGEKKNMKGLGKALKESLGELKEAFEAEMGQETEREIKKPITQEGQRDYSKYELIKAPGNKFDAKVYKEALAMSKSVERNFAFLESRFNRVIESYEQRQGHLE